MSLIVTSFHVELMFGNKRICPFIMTLLFNFIHRALLTKELYQSTSIASLADLLLR
ncbi:10710_t:CDS:2 [Dentiscutata erythropus]|uniref:10710_t:CDS:1 n=1 Tax=Dentiscutata erythropus TaxID=1348616 RepID=A0A9N8VUW6_9GLOM|nr:10710_t:CDS:2 [Dentiscutata erythropus]